MSANVIKAVSKLEYRESETVELKEGVVDEIKKKVVAFANSNGGTLYVGIKDSGEVVGLEDAETDLMDVNNMIRDGIRPDVTLFTQGKIEQSDGKSIIAVQVQRGTNRPYYLAGKGMRPEGVYIRHGTLAAPATDTAIRKMIRETDGESFEALRSMEQSLTFNYAEKEFSKRNTPFGEAQMVTLAMMTSDKIYTNLGLLLSEQCGHTIKAAVFQDNTQQAFKDRREFSGSLFQQINEVYEFLDRNNATAASFDGLLRVDKRDYPEAALREALLNAVAHREYAASGSILIKLFSDRMEFISPGGLISGLEIGDITSGYSVCRNQSLAAVFYRLNLIEAYGTGILKIFETYKTSAVQPKIEITPNVFKMILPNLNAEESVVSATKLSAQDSILQYVQKNGSINRKEAERVLGLSQTAAGNMLRSMTENGKLRKEGSSKNIRYYGSNL